MKYFREIAAIVIILLMCMGWWKYFDIRIRVALAEEQTQFFQRMVQDSAEHQSEAEVFADVEAVKIYYPSGSKQRMGSHLDLIVERARSNAISSMEARALKLKMEVQKR